MPLLIMLMLAGAPAGVGQRLRENDDLSGRLSLMFERLRNTILLVLAGAVAIRIAWALLQPLLPLLIVLGALVVLYGFLFRRKR